MAVICASEGRCKSALPLIVASALLTPSHAMFLDHGRCTIDNHNEVSESAFERCLFAARSFAFVPPGSLETHGGTGGGRSPGLSGAVGLVSGKARAGPRGGRGWL